MMLLEKRNSITITKPTAPARMLARTLSGPKVALTSCTLATCSGAGKAPYLSVMARFLALSRDPTFVI